MPLGSCVPVYGTTCPINKINIIIFPDKNVLL
jgi:ribosome recycling factor